jgi:beta-lactamase regulating signal transducer with metallopeptidase domain
MSIIQVLGESAVRSLALALAVAVVLRVLRVQHARLAKRAWTAVLILALAMPALVALHIPSFSFTALWSTPRTVIVTAPPSSLAARNAVSLNTASLDAVDRTTRATRTPAQPEDLAPAITFSVPVPAELHGSLAPARHIAWWQIGVAAYLAITALLLFRVLLGLGLAIRLWRRAQSFTTTETDLPVRLSMDLRSPATVGHGILLPLEAIEWDDAALRATLAHETEHIREGDFYLQLAATLHHCFFWISPHAWWLRPQLSRLSETICDRAAVASSGDGLSYAQLLLRLATTQQTPAGIVAMAQSAGLRERIDRLIADPELAGAFRHRRGQAMVAAALFATAAIVAAASVHIIQPATIVLAAPQAPAAPATVQAVPGQSTAPDAGPVLGPLPDVAPLPPAVIESDNGVGIGEGVGQDSAPVIRVAPRVRVRTRMVPSIDGDVIAIQSLDQVSPVVSVGPLAVVRPLIVPEMTMKVLAMPQIVIDNDGSSLDIDRHGYAICGPEHGATHACSLNGHTLKDQSSYPNGAILFERDGKTYAHVSELGKQQGELGAKQGKLGAQQGELGALQGRIGAMQGELGALHYGFPGDFKFTMPQDWDQTVRNFTDSTTRLALEQDKLSAAERGQLEAERKQAQAEFDKAMADWKAQEPQREAMEKQIREQTEQIRKQMEPLMKQMGEIGAKQSELGRLQGELGRQQSLLGEQQREASHEANQKVQSLIDQATKNGKAHPLQ